MGSGAWSASTYAATTRSKIDSGTTFGYTSTTYTAPTSTWAAHEDLDPKKLNAGGPLAGQNVRESRDSDEHPLSTPISVFFDETGSMGSVPRTVQEKLAQLFGLLLRKGYADDPQVMIGAYGDANCDYVPLQVSQFESDNRIDDALDKVFLEGNGGGNNGETMSLAWYYLANHTATDSWEKRGKKGYAFFIGDEVALKITPAQVRKFVGDEEPIGDLSAEALAAKLQEQWEVFVLVVDNYSAKVQGSLEFYRKLFGERAILLSDPDAVAETIALSIGMLEGTVDLDEGADDLKAVGASDSAIAAARGALAKVGAGAGGGAIAVSDAPEDLDGDAASRL